MLFRNTIKHRQSGLVDRASDLKPEVVGLNLGSGRNCQRLR